MTPASDWQVVRDVLSGQRLAVLATQGGGQPYASLVAIAFTPDLRTLVFATARATRKFANLAAEPRVSFLVDDRGPGEDVLTRTRTLTILGSAREAAGAERDRLAAMLRERVPTLAGFLAAHGTAVISVSVAKYVLVRDFERVTELVPA